MSDTAGHFAAYTLDAIFAQGSDGLLYRAHRTVTGEAVLLRVPTMPEEWEEAARFRARFVARARGVSTLHHPGILDILDIGFDEASGMPFVAYEAFAGQDLRELTGHGRRLPDTEIALAFAAAAEALDHAHRAGFVHGSLTPASIVVGAGAATKLLGFGIEPPVGSPTDMRGHAVGSGSYASPEQIIGGVVDGRSDLFSLGLVLFETVTGQHPFPAVPPRDARDRIVADEAPLPSKIRPETPGGFNSILHRLLQKDPTKRPSGAEVAQSLRALHERLLHPPAPVAPPPVAGAHAVPTGARAAGAPPKVPPLALAAAGAGVLVIAAAVALVLLRRPAPPPAAAVPATPAVSAAAVEQAAAEVDEALRSDDFRRAEQALAALRRAAPLDARVLDLGQRVRDRKVARIERLFDEGVGLARQAKWREAQQRFVAVLELDPGNVDARDKLDELAEHLGAASARGGGGHGDAATAVLQRPVATPVPKRLLHVVFRSPLARGEVRVAVDHRALPPIQFAFAAAATAPLGTVEHTFDMPHGSRHVLVAVVNERGNTLGEQAFVLKFEPGTEHRVTIEMATARSLPRFTASLVR